MVSWGSGDLVSGYERKGSRKERREIAEGEAAALYLNQELGTDYRVEPSDREPADVLFVSASEQHPKRMVQIVTIPHDYEVRTDNQNGARLNRDLAAQLKAKGANLESVGEKIRMERLLNGIPDLLFHSYLSHPSKERRESPKREC